LLCKHSEENNTDCIGVFDVNVKLFPPKEKVPHIGWNTLQELKTQLFMGLQNPDVYFVHSFYAEQNNFEIATCNYILPFAAALQKDNFYAVQFHPEKSGDAGSKILENFLNL
jgi:glutamine amidotransferase